NTHKQGQRAQEKPKKMAGADEADDRRRCAAVSQLQGDGGRQNAERRLQADDARQHLRDRANGLQHGSPSRTVIPSLSRRASWQWAAGAGGYAIIVVWPRL